MINMRARGALSRASDSLLHIHKFQTFLLNLRSTLVYDAFRKKELTNKRGRHIKLFD